MGRVKKGHVLVFPSLKEGRVVINIMGVFLMLIFLSGCAVTAASGTRTEYQDKMKVIEKDYREMKITEAEYIQLKAQASEQGKIAQKNDPMSTSSGQNDI